MAHACCEFMASHLHPSNCIGVRNFAQLHGHYELVSRADQFILHNFAAVAASDEFHDMTADSLHSIIASSYLNVRSEVRWLHSTVSMICMFSASARHGRFVNSNKPSIFDLY